jgi:hypothetical protein
MSYVTQKQLKQEFKNFSKQVYRRFDHVFLRLDQQDDMIGLLYKKFDLVSEQMDRRSEQMDRRSEQMDLQLKELKEINAKMDSRLTNLETWRASYTS